MHIEGSPIVFYYDKYDRTIEIAAVRYVTEVQLQMLMALMMLGVRANLCVWSRPMVHRILVVHLSRLSIQVNDAVHCWGDTVEVYADA